MKIAGQLLARHGAGRRWHPVHLRPIDRGDLERERELVDGQ